MWAHLLVLGAQLWHSAFMLGGMSALIPVASIDYQAFKAFKNIHDAAEYQWGTATFRWIQAIIVGGLAATIFRGITG